jgi:DNA-binding Lrp family transcriptional regulator
MKQEFLDETDLKLLDALQQDATLSNVALAERFNISPPVRPKTTRPRAAHASPTTPAT